MTLHSTQHDDAGSAAGLSLLARAELNEIETWRAGRRGAEAGDQITITNPSTGSRIGAVADEGATGIERAVASAEAAFGNWRSLLASERAEYLMRWHDRILAEADKLAALMTLEQGKPVEDARGEIIYGAGFVKWFAEEGQRVYGEIIPSHLPGCVTSVRQQPLGVVAAVTPWNFPSAMLLRKAAAALAAGCPVVSVPSRVTPYSALALERLAEQAGLPTGIFQVVTGRTRTLVQALCDTPKVRALSYTGSTEVGRKIMAQCAATVKRVSLELGGHAPFIVFKDADLEAAVKGAIQAKFQTGGQDCLAANRIYVAAPLYEEFVARFTEAACKLKVGDGFEQGIEIGPLATSETLQKSRDHVADAVAKGARVTCGGSDEAGGLYFTPTVIADVTPDMKITHEETFGPVAALMPFEDETDVLRRANQTEYGLVAYAYTNDLSLAQRLPDLLEYGMVAINTPKLTGAPIPFGGVKQSGIGREGSRTGILEYTETQYVCVRH